MYLQPQYCTYQRNKCDDVVLLISDNICRKLLGGRLQKEVIDKYKYFYYYYCSSNIALRDIHYNLFSNFT